MKVLYFTATGNSLYVAKKFGGEIYSIPKLIKENQFNFEDDKIGVVFPSYYNGVPKIVEKFLNKAELKSEYIFGITTYGLYPGATTKHLLGIGKRNRIKFSYINEILMIDNYLPGFDINREKEKEPKKKIEESLKKVIEDINEEKKYIKKHSAISQVIKFINGKFFYDEQFEKKFIVNSKCNGCKTCEKVCPVNNITVENQPIFNSNCQHCLACINNCPQKSITMKKEKGTERFLNKNVTLKEIIDSNN